MMKRIFVLIAVSISIISCAQKNSQPFQAPAPEKTPPSKNEAVATFAEGCFWHTEIVFQSLKGVRDAVSGYCGGSDAKPDYEKVGTGTTGHAESVNVYYDPSKISYETLVDAFFASHDPTQVDGQGNDEGPQYRSIAFYRTPAEKAILDKKVIAINSSKKYKKKVATEITAFKNFYTAEAYHQEYISLHPNNSYVRNVNIPDFLKFRSEFTGPFK